MKSSFARYRSVGHKLVTGFMEPEVLLVAGALDEAQRARSVGGAVAETVGRLMRQLGQGRQVLAVTHLPQVAACADHHLVVAKQREGATTVSSVAAVQGEQRVAEIARMLGGERLSGTTLAHAREMLGAA